MRAPTNSKQAPTLEEEVALLSQGYSFIAGIDEAGRGSLAGPVVAAAVILPLRSPPQGNGERWGHPTPRQGVAPPGPRFPFFCLSHWVRVQACDLRFRLGVWLVICDLRNERRLYNL